MFDFILTLGFELALVGFFLVCLIIFLILHKNQIHIQPIIRFGKFNILSMLLVRTSWGLKLMDSWAVKYREWVRLFGLSAIGIGFVGILVNFLLLFFMLFMLIKTPAQQQVSLVLPFTSVPGLGYIAFSHWLIAIFVLATVHEFAHGVVARVNKIPVKTSGVATLSVFGIPIIPAAFVEPDEKKFAKESDINRYAVLCAGPVSNILLAIPLLLLMTFVLAPIESQITQPDGFYFQGVQEGFPAQEAGISPNQVYTFVNGAPVTDSTAMLRSLMFQLEPGDTLTLGYLDVDSNLQNIAIQTVPSPTDEKMAYIGVTGIVNNVSYTVSWSALFIWIKDLVKILYLFNLLIGLFNLMPLYITDGGQIIRTFAEQLHGKNEKAIKLYSRICNFTLIVLLAAAFIPLFF